MKKIASYFYCGALLGLFAFNLACAGSSQMAKASEQSATAQLTGALASPAPTTVSAPATEDDKVPRIKADEAIKLVKANEAIVIDTRDESSYNNMHVKGARNIPFADFQAGKHQKLPKDKQLIFYCTWPNEHTSAGSAAILMKEGYTNVHALLGGLYAWKDANGEVEESTKKEELQLPQAASTPNK